MRPHVIFSITLITFVLGGLFGQLISEKPSPKVIEAPPSAMSQHCQSLLTDCQLGWDKAIGVSTECYDTLGMTARIINSLTDIVWDASFDEIKEIRKTPKPESVPTTATSKSPGEVIVVPGQGSGANSPLLNGNVPL